MHVIWWFKNGLKISFFQTSLLITQDGQNQLMTTLHRTYNIVSIFWDIHHDGLNVKEWVVNTVLEFGGWVLWVFGIQHPHLWDHPSSSSSSIIQTPIRVAKFNKLNN